MSANWYAQTQRKIHFDMHTPEDVLDVGAEFDGERFAQAVQDTGAEAVCFFARCAYGWSYYPTRVGLPHPNLARDLFGEGVAALKEVGIRVLAYCAIDNAPTGMIDDHPDWPKRDPEGSPVPGHGTSTSCCAFGPFPDELLIPQFVEIAQRYPVDGFFLDGVYQYFHRPCHCRHCREGFGREIPADDQAPHWRAYRHWQVKRVWEAMDRAARAVAEVRDECLLGVNWLAAIRWSVPPPPTMGYLTGDPPVASCAFDTAFNLAAWAWREIPSDLMTQRMLQGWQDFTCRTPEAIRTDLAVGRAAGGKLFVGDLLSPRTAQPDGEVVKLHRAAFAGFEQHAQSGRRIADIAILSSPETIRTRGADWPVDEAPLRGAYLAVTADGLTADILFDADLSRQLSRYRCLVIPEQPYVSRAAAKAVSDFVSGGGAVVVTGCLPAAVDPEETDEQADVETFERLCGLRSVGVHAHPITYVQLRGTPAEDLWRAGDEFRPAVPVPEAASEVEATEAVTLVTLTAPGGEYQIGARPPGQLLRAPAITVHNDAVYFCAQPLAADIWRRGNPGARCVLAGLIRRALGTPSVERRGPACVQVFRCDAQTETRISLVAVQPDGRSAIPSIVDSPPAVHGVKVSLRADRSPWRVTDGGGRPLAHQWEGGRLTIDAPPFDLCCVLVVKWESR